MRITIIISLLLLSTSLFSQMTQKVPDYRLPEYNSKRVVLSSRINPWWHLSLKTDLVGNRIQGGFAKADNDTLLYLRTIMSKQFARSVISPDVKVLDDSFTINDSTVIVFHFSNGEKAEIKPIKKFYSNILLGGPLHNVKANIDMHLYYMIDAKIVNLFQNFNMEKMNIQLLYKEEVITLEYSIKNKQQRMIKKLANKIYKIKI